MSILRINPLNFLEYGIDVFYRQAAFEILNLHWKQIRQNQRLLPKIQKPKIVIFLWN